MAGYESDSSDSLDEMFRKGGFQLSPGRSTLVEIPRIAADDPSIFDHPASQSMPGGHDGSQDSFAVTPTYEPNADTSPGLTKKGKPRKTKLHEKGPSDDPEEEKRRERARKAKMQRDRLQKQKEDLISRCNELKRANDFLSGIKPSMEAELKMAKERVCTLETERKSKMKQLKQLTKNKEVHTHSLGYILIGMNERTQEVEGLTNLHKNMSET
ncbi:uncharacterized protein LOC143024635 [Oratosquilla oratoria]|uniref:uncharacterized protein LOC143024635 n=1 Tax=Oratosquilla oratoria TaxID=337810 RepID=UPI003F76286A